MKIVIGEIKPFNKFYLEDIKQSYIKQYIKEFTSIDYFFKWAKTVTKPLFKSNFLAIINDSNTFIRDVPKMIKRLEEIDRSKKYIDIVWLTSKNTRLNGITLTCDVLNLKATHKEDFQVSIRKDLNYLTDDGYKELLKRIGYSWDNYILYQDLLKDANVSTPTDIRRLIKHETIRSAPETLSMIIERKRFCLNNYVKLKNKYSERWVKEYFCEQLDKILDAKVKYANKEINLHKIKSSQELSKYTYIILKTPITDIFLLRHFMEDSLGVESYVNYNLRALISLERESFKNKQISNRPINFI